MDEGRGGAGVEVVEEGAVPVHGREVSGGCSSEQDVEDVGLDGLLLDALALKGEPREAWGSRRLRYLEARVLVQRGRARSTSAAGSGGWRAVWRLTGDTSARGWRTGVTVSWRGADRRWRRSGHWPGRQMLWCRCCLLVAISSADDELRALTAAVSGCGGWRRGDANACLRGIQAGAAGRCRWRRAEDLR